MKYNVHCLAQQKELLSSAAVISTINGPESTFDTETGDKIRIPASLPFC